MLSEIKGLNYIEFQNQDEEDSKRLNKINTFEFDDFVILENSAIAVTSKYKLMLIDLSCVYCATCTCKDFIFRRRLVSVPAKPCKHLYKLYHIFQKERDNKNKIKYTNTDSRLKAMLNLLNNVNIEKIR